MPSLAAAKGVFSPGSKGSFDNNRQVIPYLSVVRQTAGVSTRLNDLVAAASLGLIPQPALDKELDSCYRSACELSKFNVLAAFPVVLMRADGFSMPVQDHY